MLRRLMQVAHYRAYFEDPQRHDFRALHGHAIEHEAKRLHAATYRKRGYIAPDELTPEGYIAPVADRFQHHSYYFGVVPNGATEPVAASRIIFEDPKQGMDSFQTWTDVPMTEAGKRLVESYRPADIVELSGLVKVPESSTVVVLMLYRAMWQYSLEQGYKLWLMSCDDALLKRLQHMFGSAVQPIGPATPYKGHVVVPTVIQIDDSLAFLLRPKHTIPAVKRLYQAISDFFLEGLNLEHLPRATPTPQGARESLVDRLWHWYGYTYDGLLDFWPYRNLINTAVDRLAPTDDETIVELGCGTGNVLHLIAQRSQATLIGIDRSETMLGVARHKLNPDKQPPRADIQQADILEWLERQDEHSIDAVVSVNVLYAINDQDRLWRELRRVVRPGGRIVVTTSVRTGSWPIIREHFAHDHWWRLVTPRLLGVFILDALINVLGRSGTFAFHDEATLRRAVAKIDGQWEDFGRIYGGAEAGVNILFRVTIPS